MEDTAMGNKLKGFSNIPLVVHVKRLIPLFGAGLISLLLVAAAQGQGVGSSGAVRGTVKDPNGDVLAKATVTVVNTQTGLRRTALSDDTGQYRVTNLPPGLYDVTAELTNFDTEVRRGVGVTIGETALADFQLKVTKVAERVEVTTEAPAVDTEKATQSDTIGERYIRDLPINRRDYLTYTLLMPG